MKRYAPATEKNRDAILAVLEDELALPATVLEVGAGTGQHAVYFAARLRHLTWIASDVDDAAVDSIAAWRAEAALPNLRPALQLDVRDEVWDVPPIGAIVAINLAHDAPWPTCVALLSGAGRLLPAGGPLIMYGPFTVPGKDTAPSNLEFDAQLRRENPEWGLRSLGDLERIGGLRGLALESTHDMPSNNLVVVLKKG